MTGAVLTILFIGNSLTAANNLPAQVQALARAAGVEVRCVGVTRDGFSLEDHWNDGAARRAIARGGWDLVVLQQGPSALPESRELLVKYTRMFGAEIRNAGARPALFMVWPSSDRRAADAARVSESYRLAAEAVGGVLLPVGDAFQDALRRDSTTPLFGPDGFHPSTAGTQLAADTIVRTLVPMAKARAGRHDS